MSTIAEQQRMNAGGDNDDVERIQQLVSDGADRLLMQFGTSNGFTSFGKSRLAEAALVVHIASAFIQKGHSVWPESPFRKTERGRTNHLDLLIDLDPSLYAEPHLITLEAKAIPPGSATSKIKEIIKDFGRICDWASLAPKRKPLFFSFSRPAAVYGVLAVVLVEELESNRDVAPHSLSRWWEIPTGAISGAEDNLTRRLLACINSAVRRGVVRGRFTDGGQQHSVAFAVFRCTQDNSGELMHTAEHEAAHAVVGIKTGLRVTELSLYNVGELKGGTRCDWKSQRGTGPDRDLLTKAFALAYAGSIIDMQLSGRSIGDVLNDLPTDYAAVLDVRSTAVEWGLVSDAHDTYELSQAGFALAIGLIEQNADLISDLAIELIDVKQIDEAHLNAWLSVNAAPHPVDDVSGQV